MVSVDRVAKLDEAAGSVGDVGDEDDVPSEDLSFFLKTIRCFLTGESVCSLGAPRLPVGETCSANLVLLSEATAGMDEFEPELSYPASSSL